MDPTPGYGHGFDFEPRETCICGAPLGAGAARPRTRALPGGIRFVRCGRCGSWCQSPRVRTSSLAAWYDSDAYQGSPGREGAAYANYEADEPQRREEARLRFVRDIRPLLRRRPAAILEIGCASASLLAAARDEGHAVTGVDLSARFAEQAKRLNGVDVVVGNFLEVELPESHFDAVVLLGTVSNLPDMGAAFSRISRLLGAGGRLILNYPDCASLTATLYGARFWMFTPSVMTFASTRGLVACAEAHGLRVEAVRTDRQRPSLAKLLKHSRLAAVLPGSLIRSAAGRSLPFAIPVPGVRVARLCGS